MKTNPRQFAAIRRRKESRSVNSEASYISDAYASPAISLSTLAKAMGPLAPAALTRLLAGHALRSDGPRRGYQCARAQAIALLADGTPLDPDAPLRAYERAAVTAMNRIGLVLPRKTRAERPGRAEHWELGGVRISMQPDVELVGAKGCGAAKVIFTKEPLARGVGAAMAALLWYYRKNVLHIDGTDRAHCIVYEPRLPWQHLPAKNIDRQLKNAELACKVIAALWPRAAGAA